MENIVNEIVKIIKNLPDIARAVILALLMILVVLYQFNKNKQLQQFIFNYLKKRTGRLQFKDLSAHNLFNSRNAHETIIHALRYESKQKSILFKKVLLSDLTIVLSEARKLIKDESIKKNEANVLCNKMLDMLSTAVIEHEKKIMEILISEYGDDKAIRLYEIFMNKKGGWRQYRKKRISRIIFIVDNYIRYSKIYYDNTERIEAYFNELHYSLKMLVMQAEDVFKNFNGEFN